MRACHSRSIYFVIYFIVYINCTPTYVVTNEAIKRYSAHALLLPRLHTLLLRKVIERSIPRFIAGKSALYFRLNRTRGLFLSLSPLAQNLRLLVPRAHARIVPAVVAKLSSG